MRQPIINSVVRILFLIFLPFYSFSQTPITSAGASQNFDGIVGNVPPPHWRVSVAGEGNSAVYGAGLSTFTEQANSGSPTMGGSYNWGTIEGTDRAAGFMTSEVYESTNAVMGHFKNTSGSTIHSITVTFSIERYRVNTSAFSLNFFSSTNGSSWTAHTGGDIAEGVFETGTSTYTFASPKTVNRIVTIIGLNLPANGDFYLRWVFNNSGNSNSQGLGLDNVSLTFPVLSARLGAHPNDENTNGTANPGETLTYRDTVKNSGSGRAEGVNVTYPTNANADYVPGSLKTSALARDDNYNTTYGVQLTTQNVLSNDYGIPAPTVVSYGTTASGGAQKTVASGQEGDTDAGGKISVTAAGVITYTPPASFCGVDKFAYIATTGVAGLPDNNAIVTITVNSNVTFTTTDKNPCNNQSNGSITVNASEGNGTYTYSKDGGLNYQASNLFSGLAPGTYNIVVKSGSCLATRTVTLTEPPAIVISGNDPFNIVYQAPATTTYTTPVGTPAPVTFAVTSGTLPPGLTLSSGGVLSGTPTQTGSSNITITATDGNGCTGTKTVTINVAPNIVGETYSGVGNTELVAEFSPAPANTPYVSVSSLAANDASNAAITYVIVSAPSPGNGTFVVFEASTGRFVYNPQGGNFAQVTFTYTGTSNGVTSAPATATINFTNKVWYVQADGNPTHGDGSSGNPFNSLASVNGPAGTSDFIYVQKEISPATTTPGSITLKTSQKLIGAGATLIVPGAPAIQNTTADPAKYPTLSGNVTLANSVKATGFDMNTGTTTPLISSGATLVDVDIRNVSSNGATNAVNLTGTTGTVIIAGGTQTNSTGATFSIDGGSVTLTYSGNINHATPGQPIVNVTGGNTSTITFNTGTLNATLGTGLQFDNADGTYNFLGATTLTGGDAGIDILNGSGGTFNFATTSGSIAITNPSGTAFNIGGTVNTANVTYDGNITKGNAGSMVSIFEHNTGTVTFSTGNTLSATLGDGLQFSNVDGTYNFNGTTTLNGGDAGIDILAGSDATSGSAGTFSFGSATSISRANNVSGAAFNLTGSDANVTYNGSMALGTSSGNMVAIDDHDAGIITFNTGNLTKGSSTTQGISIQNSNGGSITFSNPTITIAMTSGNAISLTNNNLSAINFTPTGAGSGIDLTTTSGIGFNSTNTTGTSTLIITGSDNTISSGTGIALNVSNTTIGASDLTFRSISSNGSSSGIVLNNTGVSGRLIVTGDGNTTQGGNSTGGTIQNTTGTGISLTSTSSPSFTNMNIQNTGSSGIGGNQVINVTIQNSTINNSGTANVLQASNIGFNAQTGTENNLSGTVTITGNLLTNAWYQGIDIFNFAGTISNAVITNNKIQSGTTTGGNFPASVGGGIRFVGFGSAGGVASITKATIDNNIINNFPGGVGLQVQGGNANSAAAPSGFYGTPGNATNIIAITNNQINKPGNGATTKTGAEGIVALVNGVGQGNFNISNNNVQQTTGTSISSSAFGNAVVTETINNNTIVSNNIFASQGIGIGTSTTSGFATNSPQLTASINGNNVSQTDGNGILAVARDASGGMLNVTIKNNTVAAPLTGVRQGIRIDAGNASGDNDVCLDISGNTSAPSIGQPAALGIGLRKQGTSTTVNAFGVEGLAATNSPGVEAFINGLNPAGGGTLLISATSGFSNCNSAPFRLAIPKKK